MLCYVWFFFKQKTAYEMRISDWSSDVCSSESLRLGLIRFALQQRLGELQIPVAVGVPDELVERLRRLVEAVALDGPPHPRFGLGELADDPAVDPLPVAGGIEAGVVAALVHLAEAGGVPDLGAAVAVALDAALRELHVAALERKSAVSGRSVSVRVDSGGRR